MTIKELMTLLQTEIDRLNQNPDQFDFHPEDTKLEFVCPNGYVWNIVDLVGEDDNLLEVQILPVNEFATTVIGKEQR